MPDNNLHIRVLTDGVFYAITDENEQVILQQEINMPAAKLKDISFLEHFFEQPEFRVLSENVIIVFENSHYQLIPSDLYRKKDVNSLFELEFGKQENCKLLCNLLPQWGAHLVYNAEEGLITFFEKKYPDAEIEHHMCKLLKRKVSRNEDVVLANLRKEYVDLVVIKDKNLSLANSFYAKTNEDVCYFILNAYEQLGLDVEAFPLSLMSEIAVDKEVAELMKQYVKEVKG